jgi:hypothetical protein
MKSESPIFDLLQVDSQMDTETDRRTGRYGEANKGNFVGFHFYNARKESCQC